MPTPLEQIKKAWNDVDEVQSLFVHCGASDTEPEAEIQYAVAQALRSRDPFKARTIDQWQLFPSDKERGINSNAAKQALNRSVRKLCALVQKNSDSIEVYRWVSKQCWRG